MNKDTLSFAAILLLFGLVPVIGIAYMGHAAKPKNRKPTQRTVYPDDHLFI